LVKIRYANRYYRLPPYIFAKIEELLQEKRRQGVDLISLGIGDPDIPTPDFIVDELIKQVKDPRNHRYPSSAGELDFREAVVDWMHSRFGLDLDPSRDVINVIGGKEGVANIARVFVNPGDIVLCPEPGYPVYANGATKLSDGAPCIMPLRKENGFLPDFESIPVQTLKDAKLMYLNYPNNPTSAVAPESFLREAADLAEDHDIIIFYDNAYSEFTYTGYKAPSFLQFSENAVELHSASKTFNMTGYRCGWVVGNADVIAGLKKIKSQIDSGCPMFIQRAVIAGLKAYNGSEPPDVIKNNIKTYQERRDILVKGLKDLGWSVEVPKATFYVWSEIPEPGVSSMEFAERLIDVGVVGTPGVGFGASGEGYIRFALTQPSERIKEAIERLSKL